MRRGNLIKFTIGLLIIALGFWYFWIKDYNYKVTFTTSSPSSIVYDHLTKWNDGKTPDIKVISLINKTPFTQVIHQLGSKDSLLKITWELKMTTDSTTLVTAKIKDVNNPILQNIKVMSSDNPFVKRSVAIVERFGKSLLKNKENYKISKVEKSTLASKYCAYVSLSCKTSAKANSMVSNIGLVMNYIKNNNLNLDGDPFIEVTEWNIQGDSIAFDFCFPLKEKGNYPPTEVIRFKKTKTQETLKVLFNGNYKISDRAWYALKDYAKFHDIGISDLPIEVFLNDPHNGGNDLEWKADVYMPIK